MSLTPPYAITSVNSAYWRLCDKIPVSDDELASSTLLPFLSNNTPPHNGFIPPARWTNSLITLLDRVRKGFPLRYHYPKSLSGDSQDLSLVYLQFFPLSEDEDILSSLLVTVMEIPVSLNSFTTLEQSSTPPSSFPSQPEAISPTLTWTAPVVSTAASMFQSLQMSHAAPSSHPPDATALPMVVPNVPRSSPPPLSDLCKEEQKQEKR